MLMLTFIHIHIRIKVRTHKHAHIDTYFRKLKNINTPVYTFVDVYIYIALVTTNMSQESTQRRTTATRSSPKSVMTKELVLKSTGP